MINKANAVVGRDDINKDTAFEIGTRTLSGLDDNKLGQRSLKRKDKAMKLAIMRCVQIDGKLIQMSSDQLSQRLLLYVVRSEANVRSTKINVKGSFIYYVRKIFLKTNIS